MSKKIIDFLKYNNATILILAFIVLSGGGVFAASDPGQAMIGEKEIKTLGVDNTLLLEADLDNLDMDFKIERITEDELYYYVTYTYLDIALVNSAWQYQIQENVRKISKKAKKDIGSYMAEELKEQYESRLKDLGEAKERALRAGGEETRTEVISYGGLIGKTLDLAGEVFPGYEPVKTRTIPSPAIPPSVLAAREKSVSEDGAADSLTEVYEDYIARMDPDRDDIFGVMDNCPDVANPGQEDGDGDGTGDACETDGESGSETDSQDPDLGTSTEESAIGSEDTATNTVEELIEEIIINNTGVENAVPDETDIPEPIEPEAETEEEPDVEIVEL
ncbi:MAG: hypothetical protein V1867_06345 [Candidatus Falkowbacteria bacterium]